MFIALSAKAQKQPQIPINRWTDKRDVVHIYSAMRKENILPFVATGMDLEHIMLNVMSQTERQVLLWYNLCMESKKVIPIKQTNKHLMESKWWLEGSGDQSDVFKSTNLWQVVNKP